MLSGAVVADRWENVISGKRLNTPCINKKELPLITSSMGLPRSEGVGRMIAPLGPVTKMVGHILMISSLPCIDSFIICITQVLVYMCVCSCTVISGWKPTCHSVHSWQRYSAAPLENQTAWTHDLISHTVTLSWHWSKQSLPYLIITEHLARKW